MKLKIALLASGRSFHATRWASALSERGIEVLFLTVHRMERPVNGNVKVVELSRRRTSGYLLDIPKLRRILASEKPDLLHAHYATGYGLMARLSGFSPRIISVYGADIYEFPKKSPLHKLLLRFNLSGASRILSTSESMADVFLKFYRDLDRPTVTPFGVDTDRFKPGKPGDSRSRIRIGIVKKMEDKYGIDVLLNAFSLLVRDGVDAELRIVGPGSRTEALKDLANRLGLTQVVFHGPMPNADVPAFLQSLDFAVIPSRLESESFGVSAVEAQACGLPVIVSNVGGLPEVIQNEETGLVVRKEDPEALASAMKRLCQDRTLCNRLGQSGRKRVLAEYNWVENVAHMIKIYGEVVGEKNGR